MAQSQPFLGRLQPFMAGIYELVAILPKKRRKIKI
jgi:hypothetical protein